MATKNNFLHKFQISKLVTSFLILTMLAVTMYFANVLIKQSQNLSIGAASGTANIFFEPAKIAMPADSLINLWVTTDKPLGFIATEITFDKSLINLSQEITLPTPSLKRVINITSMSEANSTGKIKIVLGVDPSGLTTAPTGSFALAGLKFTSKTSLSNKETTLFLSSANSQLVDLNATPFTTTVTPGYISLNPVASPTATPTTTLDETAPTIAFTNPSNNSTVRSGSTVTLSVSALDNLSVTKVQFYVNGSLKCTDSSSPYTCLWKPRFRNRVYNLKAVGYDAAENYGASTIQVKSN